MWIAVEHRLRFRYSDFIRESQLELRVQPRATETQTLHEFSIAVGPPSRPFRYFDWNGNPVHYFGVTSFHDRIDVDARSIVETRPAREELPSLTAPPQAPSQLGELRDFVEFGGPIVRSRRLEEMGAIMVTPADAPVVDQMRESGDAIFHRFRYETGITNVHSTTEDLFEGGVGVCQDFAHLHLAILRLRGIPCRYVSGYVAEEGREAQSHAWIEAYTADHGWLSFDATHNRMPDDKYVTVAWGRSYGDVPPNRGIFRGDASETLEVEVLVNEVPARRGAPSLHEEVRSLDVPVFREPPSRDASQNVEDVGDPQQQQQQQQ
ncbi:MAG: transglutaminase family protein [Myxococcales bacterium]|nr:transglutaminase family protein [Myxococcales bacterium]